MIILKRIGLLIVLWFGLPIYICAQGNFLWIQDGYDQSGTDGNSVGIILANEQTLGGFQLNLNYDPSLVQFEEVMVAAGHISEMDVYTSEPEWGILTIVVVGLNGQVIYPGSSLVFEVQCIVQGNNQNEPIFLGLTNVVFSDIEGNTVPGGSADGFFFVEGVNALRLGNGFSTVAVDLYNDFSAGGVQFTLSYDPNVISLDQVQTAFRSEEMDLSFNEFSSGMVTILLYSFDQNIIAPGSGPVLNLLFENMSEESTASALDLSDVSVSNEQGYTVDVDYYGATYFSIDPSLFVLIGSFTASPEEGQLPLTVQFTDMSASPEPGGVDSWQWDFENDGVIDSYEQNPVWLYEQIGTYSVQLTVSNGVDTDTILLESYIRIWDFETPLPVTVLPESGFIVTLPEIFPSTTLSFILKNDNPETISYNMDIVSADSTYIIYTEEPDSTSYNGNIWRMRPDGTDKTQLTFATLDLEPVWSPDGEKIVFYSLLSGNYDIWLMNEDGSSLNRLTDHPAGDYGPSWSPDGEYILFSSDRDTTVYGKEIYQIPSTGGNVERLTFNEVNDGRPVYSPDGRYIVTQSKYSGGDYDIFIYTSDGELLNILGTQGESDYQPAWSPSGKRIFWSGIADGLNRNILSAKADGSDPRVEVNTDLSAYRPRPSPDGQFIAFSNSVFYETGGDEIFVWNRQTQELTQISDSTPIVREWGPEWSPFISAPDWLSINQSTGELEPDESIMVNININAFNFELGEHHASILIKDNQTGIAIGSVPLTIEITDTCESEPLLYLVEDVPNDQGWWARLSFAASCPFGPTPEFPDNPAGDMMGIYTVWREFTQTREWEVIGSFPGANESTYNYLVPTLGNATYEDTTWTTYRISFTASPYIWYSGPVSGFSVDNIIPATPTGLIAEYSDGSVSLGWDGPVDEDFHYFTIYRNGVVCDYSVEPFYIDENVSIDDELFYFVTATDANENESDPSEEAYVSQMSISISFVQNWNLVGLPLTTDLDGQLDVFPSSVEGTLYSFDETYVQESSLIPGTGYWLRFPEDGEALMTGSPIDNMILHLQIGWNLISGITGEISVNEIIDENSIIVPGTLFGFSETYVYSTTLVPGQGYWLRAFNEGDVILSSNSNRTRKHFVSSTDGANSIKINGQELFFGKEIMYGQDISYTLPPKPPVGAFDARYADNRRLVKDYGEVEIVNSGEILLIEYEIVIDVGEYYNWVLKMGDGNEHIIEGKGELVVPSSERMILERKEVVPEKFTLHQNFPNPFNPVTTLRYDLPEQSHVTLTVYDMLGKDIIRLVNTTQKAGFKSVRWNATDNMGRPVSAGVYVYHIEAGEFVQTKKMVLLK